jgi:hypothetical protein
MQRVAALVRAHPWWAVAGVVLAAGVGGWAVFGLAAAAGGAVVAAAATTGGYALARVTPVTARPSGLPNAVALDGRAGYERTMRDVMSLNDLETIRAAGRTAHNFVASDDAGSRLERQYLRWLSQTDSIDQAHGIAAIASRVPAPGRPARPFYRDAISQVASAANLETARAIAQTALAHRNASTVATPGKRPPQDRETTLYLRALRTAAGSQELDKARRAAREALSDAARLEVGGGAMRAGIRLIRHAVGL